MRPLGLRHTSMQERGDSSSAHLRVCGSLDLRRKEQRNSPWGMSQLMIVTGEIIFAYLFIYVFFLFTQEGKAGQG